MISDARLDTCTQFFEAGNLRLDVVGLDIEMNRALLRRNALEQQVLSTVASNAALQ